MSNRTWLPHPPTASVEEFGRMIAKAIERMSPEQKAVLRENVLRSARERLNLIPNEQDRQFLRLCLANRALAVKHLTEELVVLPNES